MNKIMLITTEGCLGCNVMKNSIDSALNNSKITIIFEKLDISEVDKKFIKQHNITDFPTTLFMKNDIVVFKTTGSVPSVVVLRWIDVHLR